MIRFPRFTALICTLALTSLAACSRAQQTPLVSSVSTQMVANDLPSANPEAVTTQAIRVSAIVDKNALLSQEFLYGADLQYSSHFDADMDLYNQSMAIGHVPARFRITGDELQLVTDNRRLFPSDVNHPEQLIMRFKILAQTEKALTISEGDSGAYLASIFHGTHEDTHGGLTAPVAAKPLDRWTRSFEFIPRGNYLLQQTSIVLANGKQTTAEFMESIFPRSTLEPGAQFQKFEMDPSDPVGGSDDLLQRFRLLTGENIFQGEKKLAYAQHFDISKTASNPTGTIDWYVTRNITDEDMLPVKLAVEGWNRYFLKYKGIEREVVRFMGRLPEGIHLGDPRYNVINWDSRLIAGAAYESQATDPLTGKQSHSLIYMPAAWLRIGTDYWKNGQYSEVRSESVAPAALEAKGGVTQRARLSCMRDMREASALLNSGRLSADEVKNFGIELLKGTLMHEVGHALGLAHNFKGSLTFDRSDKESMFSTSVMDYNAFEIESAVFSGVDQADGPQLEYDRQVLSAIYNQSKDIAETDAVLPACNDAEADQEEGGVDPLCIRYDLEKDPTLSIATAWDRIYLATKENDVTMAQALTRVPSIILTSEELANAKSEKELKSLVTKLTQGLRNSMHFYLGGGKASLVRVVKTNTKALLTFSNNVLPESIKEDEMRARALTGIKKALALNTLPVAVTASTAEVEKVSLQALATTPFLSGMSKDKSDERLAKIGQTLRNTVKSMESDLSMGLPKLRASVLASLTHHDSVSYASEQLEATLTNVLANTITAGASEASMMERKTAALALATFSGRYQGNRSIHPVIAALEHSLSTTTDSTSTCQILGILDPANKTCKK